MASDYYPNLSIPIHQDKPRVTVFDNGGTLRAQCHLCRYHVIVVRAFSGKPWWHGKTHYCLRGRITQVVWIDKE
jgi:hypothetical protein